MVFKMRRTFIVKRDYSTNLEREFQVRFRGPVHFWRVILTLGAGHSASPPDRLPPTVLPFNVLPSVRFCLRVDRAREKPVAEQF